MPRRSWLHPRLPAGDASVSGQRDTRSRDDLTEDGFVLRYRTDETDTACRARKGRS